MGERPNMVTVGGNSVTLVGDEIGVNDKAPDVDVTNTDLKDINLSKYRGKVVILSTLGSLDTATCDTETRKFNEEAANLGDDIEIVFVSMDLPFAIKRWCGAAGVERVEAFSDYKGARFGDAYGVLVKETRLLARSIFVLDKEGVVRYREIVPEVADEPNYEAAIEAAKKLL